MKFAIPVLAVIVSASVSAEQKRIQLPDETVTFRPGKGTDLAALYCYTCHSAEYVSSQPPLPRKYWEATVIKMKEKFGAPIPDASVQELADYLTQAYGKK